MHFAMLYKMLLYKMLVHRLRRYINLYLIYRYIQVLYIFSACYSKPACCIFTACMGFHWNI